MSKDFFVFLCVVLLLAVVLHFGADKFPDPDVFYHFRHADLYWENSIAMSGFPWVSFSVINDFSSDIWYGFHFLLIPFTWFQNEILGLNLAGVFVTAAALLIFYFAVKKAGIFWHYFWPFFLLFSSPLVLYRFTMLRPHLLSLALSALFFVFAVQGSIWGVFWAGFLIAFFHLGLFWAPVLIFGIVALVKFFSEKIIIWRSGAALALGLLLGWVLRPNPLGALKIAKTQIFDLLIARKDAIPLNFGMELSPMTVSGLAAFSIFTIFWLSVMFIFFCAVFKKNQVVSKRQFLFLWAGLVLSLIFFLLTLFVAQRSFDFWVMFGVLFIAFVFTYFLRKDYWYKYALAAIFLIMVIYSFYGYQKNISQFGWDAERFRSASEWLKENSKEGEIVFNVAWEYFPELFFWNTHNRYISGMDPIFQYIYDPELYWKAYYLGTGRTTGFTCASTFCEEKDFEDTYAVLKNDFGASFVFLSRAYDDNLYNYFSNDQHYSLGYENADSAVFKIIKK
ncbi:MAG: hypothetical protein HYY55_00185 [Candidatus Niyogibacteria bacterium]|nr:MAG: hypothetical protein HYY55_00185 [Candidatus Niyogibacteria bacterium]